METTQSVYEVNEPFDVLKAIVGILVVSSYHDGLTEIRGEYRLRLPTP